MVVRSSMAWLVILALALLLFTSCESGGHYRYGAYQFGGGAGWHGNYARQPWGYYPGYGGRYRPSIGVGEPIAAPLPTMGYPDFGGVSMGGFD